MSFALRSTGVPVVQRKALGTIQIRVARAVSPKVLTHVVRSASDEASSVDVEKIMADLKTKWNGLDNKTTVLGYGAGAIAAMWVASSIVSAIDGVPLLPKLMELVGLIYCSWFTYRYLLFKTNREELLTEVEDLKKKISGSEDV